MNALTIYTPPSTPISSFIDFLLDENVNYPYLKKALNLSKKMGTSNHDAIGVQIINSIQDNFEKMEMIEVYAFYEFILEYFQQHPSSALCYAILESIYTLAYLFALEEHDKEWQFFLTQVTSTFPISDENGEEWQKNFWDVLLNKAVVFTSYPIFCVGKEALINFALLAKIWLTSKQELLAISARRLIEEIDEPSFQKEERRWLIKFNSLEDWGWIRQTLFCVDETLFSVYYELRNFIDCLEGEFLAQLLDDFLMQALKTPIYYSDLLILLKLLLKCSPNEDLFNDRLGTIKMLLIDKEIQKEPDDFVFSRLEFETFDHSRFDENLNKNLGVLKRALEPTESTYMTLSKSGDDYFKSNGSILASKSCECLLVYIHYFVKFLNLDQIFYNFSTIHRELGGMQVDSVFITNMILSICEAKKAVPHKEIKQFCLQMTEEFSLNEKSSHVFVREIVKKMIRFKNQNVCFYLMISPYFVQTNEISAHDETSKRKWFIAQLLNHIAQSTDLVEQLLDSFLEEALKEPIYYTDLLFLLKLLLKVSPEEKLDDVVQELENFDIDQFHEYLSKHSNFLKNALKLAKFRETTLARGGESIYFMLASRCCECLLVYIHYFVKFLDLNQIFNCFSTTHREFNLLEIDSAFVANIIVSICEAKKTAPLKDLKKFCQQMAGEFSLDKSCCDVFVQEIKKKMMEVENLNICFYLKVYPYLMQTNEMSLQYKASRRKEFIEHFRKKLAQATMDGFYQKVCLSLMKKPCLAFQDLFFLINLIGRDNERILTAEVTRCILQIFKKPFYFKNLYFFYHEKIVTSSIMPLTISEQFFRLSMQELTVFLRPFQASEFPQIQLTFTFHLLKASLQALQTADAEDPDVNHLLGLIDLCYTRIKNTNNSHSFTIKAEIEMRRLQKLLKK